MHPTEETSTAYPVWKPLCLLCQPVGLRSTKTQIVWPPDSLLPEWSTLTTMVGVGDSATDRNTTREEDNLFFYLRRRPYVRDEPRDEVTRAAAKRDWIDRGHLWRASARKRGEWAYSPAWAEASSRLDPRIPLSRPGLPPSFITSLIHLTFVSNDYSIS